VSRGSIATGDLEKQRLAGAAMIDQLTSVENAFNRILGQGYSRQQIIASVPDPNPAVYGAMPCTTSTATEICLFDTDAGGLNLPIRGPGTYPITDPPIHPNLLHWYLLDFTPFGGGNYSYLILYRMEENVCRQMHSLLNNVSPRTTLKLMNLPTGWYSAPNTGAFSYAEDAALAITEEGKGECVQSRPVSSSPGAPGYGFYFVIKRDN
jgi:hypothetical protein